jgi:hypothetical protein
LPEHGAAAKITGMKLQDLTVGMKVLHPQYGAGVVEKISNVDASIRFENVLRTVDPQLAEIAPAEKIASVEGLHVPLKQFIDSTVESILRRLGFENPNAVVAELGARWHKGKMVLHPADPALQTKEVPLEVFFHKLVGVRNQLRVLEQKINSHSVLTDGEKVEMQQYITRCYGSLTTFNILFKDKEDQFSSKGE